MSKFRTILASLTLVPMALITGGFADIASTIHFRAIGFLVAASFIFLWTKICFPNDGAPQ